MLVIGIDLGTSSVKVTVVETQSRQMIATAHYPEAEAEIISIQTGWAEQNPGQWWENVCQAILKCHSSGSYHPGDIAAIGIAYQMHGLVIVDKQQQVLRNSIIWCDSRAVEIGDHAFKAIGEEKCLSHLLNSPGNFTASKLAWVKRNEPSVYEKIEKVMLPGDFIGMKLTGEISTTVTALSEGIFWDFKNNNLSEDILNYFGFNRQFFPEALPSFAIHGYVSASVANRLLLKTGIPVSYKAGDQPNNALSLNVLNPGEVAATAGTSGVIYGISDKLRYDPPSRINSFAHVNHEPDTKEKNRIGILLCINGAGIFNRWIKNIAGNSQQYKDLNEAAAKTSPGADGLIALPFGNGAERMFNNRILGGQFDTIDFNIHTTAHMVRAVQESVAFSFRYGLDIMRENGIDPTIIRAGRSNLFLSDVFSRSFAAVTNVAIEFYEGDGSLGAAIGAGIGAGIYNDAPDAMESRKPIHMIEPEMTEQYESVYKRWLDHLNEKLGHVHV